MKAILILALSFGGVIAVRAQSNGGGSTSTSPGASGQSVPLTVTNGFDVSVRTPTDWNATAVQIVSPFADDSGQTQYQTNSYNELSPGANFIADDGLLHPSDPSFVLVSNEARAWTGQSQLTLAANANSPVLFRARLPDGQFVGTRMQGVFIFDSASGQTVQLASLRDSVGIQIETNKILYPDCFDGGGAISADLLFVNTLNGWSQDVVLKSFTVDDSWLAQAGLTNSEGLTAEIWTEFVEGATPRQTPVWVQGTMGDTPVAMADTQLDFGDFIRMDTGKAFVFGQPNQDVSLVAKQWVQTPDQRQFLVESVPLALLQTGMQALPQSKPGKAQVQVRRRAGSRLEAMARLPRGIRGEGKEKREARIRPLKDAAKGLLAWLGQPALIWDYTTLNTGGVTNYSFLGDTTFYLPSSSAVTCYGTNTYVEGGCVIKLNTSASLSIKTPLSWNASMGRPVVICSSDDKSTGENIAGASGSPGTTLYGTAGLILDPSTNGAANASFNIAHLRVANMNTAIQFVSGGTNAHSLRHIQMVNCGVGVAPNGDSFSLLNGLMANVTTGFGGSSTGAIADIEHLTYDGGTTFQAANILGTLGMTNSIIAGVGSVSVGTATNQVAILASNSGLFQSLSLGSTHYLVTNSPYRGIGTSSINPTLAGDLIDMVTTAPIELGTNYTVSSNAALTPQIPRDIGSQPDLGAHFYPLDYVVHGITVSGSSTLSLLNGVAVGFYGASTGISPGASAKVSSLGLPENLNRLTLVSTVFEQPQAWISNLTSFTLLNSYGSTLRFTDVSFLASPTGARALYPVLSTANTTVQDSQLRGVYWNAVSYSPNGTGTLTLKNSLLERCTLNWTQGYSGTEYYLGLNWQNSLFNRCSLTITFGSTNFGIWSINDCLFDNCSTLSYSTMDKPFTSFSYNGYVNSTHWLSGTGDKTGLIEDFVQGPLGNYYYPASGGTGSTATLIDADSTRTASGVGLAEYTTLLSQTKDTGNLDIGMHLVSLETHQASAEFSAYQGTNNWYYARTTAPLGSTVVYFATNGTPGSVGLTWYDSTLPYFDSLDWIWSNGQIPGWDYDSLRIWQSPATAKLSVWSTATNSGYTGSGCSSADGAFAWIERNGIGLTPWSYLATNATPVSINGRTYTQSGDAFFFQVNKGAANNYCDLIYWDPLIIVHRGASTLVSGLPDWFADSNGDGSVNSSDGTGDWDGDGVTDRNDGSPFDPSNSAFQITIERPTNGSTIN